MARYGGRYREDTVLTLNRAERAKFKRMFEETLADVPDMLTVDEVSTLPGYSRTTILRYVRKKYIYAVKIKEKCPIAKSGVIKYFASDRAFQNMQKTEWHINFISKYKNKYVE